MKIAGTAAKITVIDQEALTNQELISVNINLLIEQVACHDARKPEKCPTESTTAPKRGLDGWVQTE